MLSNETTLDNKAARLWRTASTVGCAPTVPEIFSRALYLVRSAVLAALSRSVADSLMQSFAVVLSPRSVCPKNYRRKLLLDIPLPRGIKVDSRHCDSVFLSSWDPSRPNFNVAIVHRLQMSGWTRESGRQFA